MADISDATKKQAGAVARGDFSSIAEEFQAQLEGAKSKQASFEAFQPTAKANAEAIGGFEGRAPGESPVDVRAQGLTTAQAISSTASKTQGNILDVLISMMNLKDKQNSLDQQGFDNQRALNKEELEANELGMTVDATTGQPRPLTDAEKEDKQLSGLDATTEAYLKMFQNGSMKKISEIPAADRGEVVRALDDAGIDPEAISTAKEGVGVEGILRTVFDNYAINNDLSRGRIKGTISNIAGAVGKDAAVKRYNALTNGILASIRNFVGEKGIMTEPDAQRIKDLLPKVTSTDEEAVIAWNDINSIFSSTYGYNVIPEDMITAGAPKEETIKEETVQERIDRIKGERNAK